MSSKKYINKHYYHDERFSGYCLKTWKQVYNGLAGLSTTCKLEEVQEQLCMKVLGLCWKTYIILGHRKAESALCNSVHACKNKNQLTRIYP